MSIEQAERLKKDLTDKWVVVASGVPELRRFEAFTGRVKTVNMNCRALVEFQGSEDIGWYDIDPQFLTVVDAPGPKSEAKPEAKEKSAAKSAAAAPAASGGSPLDQIRAQAGGAKPAAAPAKPASGGGSPLDQIRAQAGGAKPAAAPAKPASGGGSPLDQIRAQAAGGAAPAAKPAAAPQPAAPVEEPTAETPPPAPPASAPVDTTGLSPLDIIRAQGAFKGDQ